MAKRNALAAILVAGGALLAAGGLSIAAAADDAATTATPAAPRPHDHGHGWGPAHMFSKLGLTTEQQASIKAIMTAAKPQMISMHEQMKANHLKLMQTKPDDPNYANVVAEAAEINATLASQRTTQESNLRAQMYAVLTPAQKTQLATLEAQWAAEPHRQWGSRGSPAAAPAAP
jgi:Spy/CpxP family protein refolding chaperone